MVLACTSGAGCTSGTVVLAAPGPAEVEAATRPGMPINEHMLLTESASMVGLCLRHCIDCNTAVSCSLSALPCTLSCLIAAPLKRVRQT